MSGPQISRRMPFPKLFSFVVFAIDTSNDSEMFEFVNAVCVAWISSNANYNSRMEGEQNSGGQYT